MEYAIYEVKNLWNSSVIEWIVILLTDMTVLSTGICIYLLPAPIHIRIWYEVYKTTKKNVKQYFDKLRTS